MAVKKKVAKSNTITLIPTTDYYCPTCGRIMDSERLGDEGAIAVCRNTEHPETKYKILGVDAEVIE